MIYNNLRKIQDFIDKIDINKNYYDDTKSIIIMSKALDLSNFKITGNNKTFMHKQINLFIKQITDNNFTSVYLKLDDVYFLDEFWRLISHNIIEINFSSETFFKILRETKVRLVDLLKNNEIVSKYDNEIVTYMLEEFLISVPIIAKKYIEETKKSKNKAKKNKESKKNITYLPNIKDSEINDLFIKYIDSCNELSGLQYLYTNRKLLPSKISDSVVVNIINKYEKLNDAFFVNKNGIECGVMVSIKNQKEISEIKQEKFKTFKFYSKKWIDNNLDYPTVLNNFIYVFEFVDLQCRFFGLSHTSELSAFEIAINKDNNLYYKEIDINRKELILQFSMASYYEELEENNIFLENVIQWFYSDYLKEEFGIEDFNTNFSREMTSSFNKCRIFLPEIDSIFKQYNLYVQHKKINRDLIEVSTNSVPFGNVKSLLDKKYIYGMGRDFNKLEYLFFSDQNMMSFSNDNKDYSCFYERLLKEDVLITDIREIDEDDLNWLINRKFIHLEKSIIKVTNRKQLIILKSLYKNDYINYYHYPKEYRIVIDKLIDNKYLKFDNNLLSKNEVEYFNYFLNNKTCFSDQHEIRNRYLHGTQSLKLNNEKIHKINYNWILYIIVLITIKINDDLCLYDKFKNDINKKLLIK